MLNAHQTALLRQIVIVRAELHAKGADYDRIGFRAPEIAPDFHATSIEVYEGLQALESEGLVEWHRPASIPGYWMPTAKARGERP